MNYPKRQTFKSSNALVVFHLTKKGIYSKKKRSQGASLSDRPHKRELAMMIPIEIECGCSIGEQGAIEQNELPIDVI